jgi:hypothetical protein
MIIHPFLFAVFPVLYLFSNNVSELELAIMLIPAAIAFLFAIGLFFVGSLVIKDRWKAAVLLSLAFVLFYSYGPFSGLIKDFRVWIGSFAIGPHKSYMILAVALFGIAAFYTLKTRKSLQNLTKVLNLVSLSLIFISVLTIGIHEFSDWRLNIGRQERILTKTGKRSAGKAVRHPDIYYIILDGYGSAEILEEMYGFKNQGFMHYLMQKGFYVAHGSKSNYHGTIQSLASSLNLSYLDPADGFQGERYSHNRLFSLMKRYGYITAFVSSLDTDVRMNNADHNLRLGWLNDYHYKLLDLTPMPYILSQLQIDTGSYSLHRERIHYVFDTIANRSFGGSPVFIYAHVFAPHPPFVFGPNGEEVDPGRTYSTEDAKNFYSEGGTRDQYVIGYRDQLRYINKRLMVLIDGILSRKDRESVIILQGDHGPRSMTDMSNPDETYLKEAYSILNAYYLPGSDYKMLYESITPVNTFRVVFNLYFGQDYALLKDRIFYYNYRLSPPVVDVTRRVHLPRKRD